MGSTDCAMWSGVLASVKDVCSGRSFSYALSGELKAVSVVDQAIQDGVGQGGIADDLVPAIDGDLACDDRGCVLMAILADSGGCRPGVPR